VDDHILGGPSANILLVCSANQARSPVAEVLLEHAVRAPGLSVSSAGVRAQDGRPAAEMAVELASTLGFDLSQHRTRAVTPDLVAQSDLILAMSEWQRDHCAGMVAGMGSRTFTLREFVRLLGTTKVSGGPVTTTDRLKWLRGKAHVARPMAIHSPHPEDIADPINEPWRSWQQLGTELGHLVDRIGRAVNDGE